MKAFSVEKETVEVSAFQFAGAQREKASANNVERVFRFRDINGNVAALPKYVRSAIADAGYVPVYLGGTTYSHSIIGMKRP